jgi:hypothetical protein
MIPIYITFARQQFFHAYIAHLSHVVLVEAMVYTLANYCDGTFWHMSRYGWKHKTNISTTKKKHHGNGWENRATCMHSLLARVSYKELFINHSSQKNKAPSVLGDRKLLHIEVILLKGRASHLTSESGKKTTSNIDTISGTNNGKTSRKNMK